MLNPDSPPGPTGPGAPIDPARMALYVFAELTQSGGTNAVADVEGVAAVGSALLSELLRLLAEEGVPVGTVICAALEQQARKRREAEGVANDPPHPPGA